MNNPNRCCFLKKHNNEEGFILIASVLFLLVLSFIAAAMSNTTTMEMMIAGNDKFSHEQFFKADAGVNTMIAQNTIPNNSFLPANYPANDFLNCNTPRGQLPFVTYDLDGDATNDVSLYYMSRTPGPPIEIEITSCALQGDTTASIVAGLEFATVPGPPTEDGLPP